MNTFIVTGASRGIGFETALALAQEGHQVIATARSLKKLQSLQREGPDGRIRIVEADLQSAGGIPAIADALKDGETISGLINNAGLVLNKPFLDTSREEWMRVFDVNFFSVIELVKTLHPFMDTGSHIVNIGSMGGFQGSAKFPGLSAYSSAKGALAILSECLSEEFSEHRISVNCLCLGAVQTEMLAEAFPGFEAPVQPQGMGAYIADFAVNGHRFYNGKVLPVALNNPE